MSDTNKTVPVNVLNNDVLAGSYTADSLGGSSNAILSIRDDISRYLSSKGTKGILQMLREMIENSIDEHAGLLINFWKDPDISLGILMKFFADGSAMVKDQGRGIPIGLKDIDGNGLSRIKLNDFKYDMEENKGKLYRKEFEGPLSLSEVYALPDNDPDAEWDYIRYTKDRPWKYVEAPEYASRIAPALIHAMERDTFGGKGNKGASSSNDAYKKARTGGVHGAGMCVTLAACESFEVINTIRGEDKSYVIGYTKGIRTTELQEVPLKRLPNGQVDYGFTVKFKHDPDIMNMYDGTGKLQEYPYDVNEIKTLVRNYAMACDRIDFYLDFDVPGSEPEKVVMKSSEYDAKQLLLANSSTKQVYEDDFSGEDNSDPLNPIDYELKVVYTLGNASSCRVLVNRLMTTQSTVKNTYMQVLNDVLYEKFRQQKMIHPQVPLKLDLDRYFVSAILMLGINNPEFSGQVKSEFHNPRLSSLLDKQLTTYFTSGDGHKYIMELYGKTLPLYKRRVEEFNKAQSGLKNKALEDFKDKSKRSTKVNDRMTFPDNRNYNECFCILVEGDTGAGKINSYLQSSPNAPNNIAVFTLEGKILNVLKNDITKSKDTEMFELLFQILGKYPWKRIVVFTDGDVDGYHIRDQVSAVMVDNYPEYIFQNRFSILQSPLCKMRVKDNSPRKYREIFFFSPEEVDAFVEQHKDDILENIGYKGIGSLDAVDMAELLRVGPDGNLVNEYVIIPEDGTLNPERAVLNQFFGKGVAFRKQYIENHFMTDRYSMYTATRKDRFKDLGINIEYYKDAGESLALNTEGMLSKSGLTSEFSSGSIRQGKYLTPVEFILQMNDKYGAGVSDIHSSTSESDDEFKLFD